MTTTTPRNYQEWRFENKFGEERPELQEFAPAGPWDDEPDKVQWIDEATDLDCLILRNRFGALCGYVGVGPDHPYYQVDYNQCMEGCKTERFGDVELPDSVPMPDSLADREFYPCWGHSPEAKVEVHGGLTFSGFCQEEKTPGAQAICHVPADGREDKVWWLGFDCAHAFDLAPGSVALDRKLGMDEKYGTLHENDVYRDIEYVKGEVTNLAKQLAEVAAT